MTLHVYLINRETTTDVTFQQNKQSESQKNASGSIADGIDDGFKYGLIIGIPILLIILILPFMQSIDKRIHQSKIWKLMERRQNGKPIEFSIEFCKRAQANLSPTIVQY